MTDARTLLAQMLWEAWGVPVESSASADYLRNVEDTPSGQALLAAAAEAATLRERIAALAELVGEMVVDYHQTGLIRDHVDPGAKGWDVNKDWRICEDVLCEAARQLLAPTPATDEERCWYPGCTAPDAHGKSVCMGGGVCAAHHPFQPTPATDEARCGWCGGSGRIVSGFKVCPKCNGLGRQPTPTEPACFLCRRTKDEHAARTDLLHTFTPEPAPRAIAYGSIPGSDDWVMADPEPGS